MGALRTPPLDALGQRVVRTLLGDQTVEDAVAASGWKHMGALVVRTEHPLAAEASSHRDDSARPFKATLRRVNGFARYRVAVGWRRQVCHSGVWPPAKQRGDAAVDSSGRPHVTRAARVDVVTHHERLVELQQPFSDLWGFGDDISTRNGGELAVVGRCASTARDGNGQAAR